MTPPAPEWTLLEAMACRKIRTAAELRERLSRVGVEISASQLSRIINAPPARLSMRLLGGLLVVLHCQPNELLRRVDAAEGAANLSRPDSIGSAKGKRKGRDTGVGEPPIGIPSVPTTPGGSADPPRGVRSSLVPIVGPLPIGERMKR